MRLVHGQQGDLHALHAQAERFGGQPLGGDVEKFDVAVHAVVQRDVDLAGAHSRVDRRGPDFPRPQPVHLVFHQGDQRGYDYDDSLPREARNLIGEGFAAAGGHQGERVVSVEHRADDPLLHGAELVESPVAFEQRSDRLRGLFCRGFHTRKDNTKPVGFQRGHILRGRIVPFAA